MSQVEDELSLFLVGAAVDVVTGVAVVGFNALGQVPKATCADDSIPTKTTLI